MEMLIDNALPVAAAGKALIGTLIFGGGAGMFLLLWMVLKAFGK